LSREGELPQQFPVHPASATASADFSLRLPSVGARESDLISSLRARAAPTLLTEISTRVFDLVPHGDAAPPSPPALARASPVDPHKAFCHSQKRLDSTLIVDQGKACASFTTIWAAYFPSRATARNLLFPNRRALNPAVQFNRFYPPCCRMTDKILFVKQQYHRPSLTTQP
jgi:hypothetical protein